MIILNQFLFFNPRDLMRGSVYKPKDPKVSAAISCMGYIEMQENDNFDAWFGLVPNGSSNLTIALSDDQVEYQKTQGRALLYAACKSPIAMKKSRGLKFINIQFKPQGLYYFTGIPQTEFPDEIFDLRSIFSRLECDELLGRVYDANSTSAKFEAIENFLASRINPKFFDDRINFALSLLKTRQNPRIKELSDQVFLSSRRFRELFQEKTGFTPSFLRKVERVNKAMDQILLSQSISLTDLALQNRYFDQSHFIKDFKLLSGVTPSIYLKQKAKISDFYNFDLYDLKTFTSNV